MDDNCGIKIGPNPVIVMAHPIARPLFSLKYVFTASEVEDIAMLMPSAANHVIIYNTLLNTIYLSIKKSKFMKQHVLMICNYFHFYHSSNATTSENNKALNYSWASTLSHAHARFKSMPNAPVVHQTST